MTTHHKVYSTSIRMYIRSICACIIVCHMDTGVVIVNGGRAYLVVAPQEVYMYQYLCCGVSHGHWEDRHVNRYLHNQYLITANLLLYAIDMIH